MSGQTRVEIPSRDGSSGCGSRDGLEIGSSSEVLSAEGLRDVVWLHDFPK